MSWSGCFNPRPREGGDARTTPTPALTCWFQSTPPRRRRLHQKRRPRRATGFQSTPPRRRRPGHVFPDNPGRLVSIHAPAKEATSARRYLPGRPDLGFNPRPREGGDRRLALGFSAEPSFNPRPREGGDQGAGGRGLWRYCFNPRPREGGDCMQVPYRSADFLFQSTPPRRRRQLVKRPDLLITDVSIHAPAKEATRQHRQDRVPRMCFNPRPREGGDTHLHYKLSQSRCFNPRPREGGDPHYFGNGCSFRVSIHAPAKEATSSAYHGGHIMAGFNPRPREGGDNNSEHSKYCLFKFQSTPPRRRRRCG